MNCKSSLLLVVSAFIAVTVVWAKPPESRILGYINTVPPESAEARAARHKVIAERRGQDNIIIVHRGANRVAPENTLEAYAAAMELGADGVEIDIRRSRDGVLYFMHDDKLDRTTNGHGRNRDHTYYEILQAGIRRGGRDTRVPTLPAFLALARQRGMLLHLDVKEPGLEAEIEKLLDQADVWDHIVEVNAGNAERLRVHLKVKLIPYKGSPPNDEKSEAARAGIRAWIERRDGRLGMVEDPRAVAKALGRKPLEAKPLPKYLRAWWTPAGIEGGSPASSPASAPMSQMSHR